MRLDQQGRHQLSPTRFSARFLQRVDERVKTVDELLAAPLDFTADEQMVSDPDAAHYPRTPAEAVDRWRQRIKYDLLLLKTADKKADKKEGKEAIDKLARATTASPSGWHQTDGDELLEMYLNAVHHVVRSAHRLHVARNRSENFDIAMSLELEGIGASLQTRRQLHDGQEDHPRRRLDKMNKDWPDRKGRHPLTTRSSASVKGDEGEMVNVVDMKISNVVKLIRGKRGTIVRLEVIPADGSGRKIYKITREKIELKDSEAKGKVFDVGRKPDGTPYRVGVIELPSFYRDMAGDRRGLADFRSTTRNVRNILDDFQRQGVDAVVLDLRYNGGGALSEAISLTGLFIPERADRPGERLPRPRRAPGRRRPGRRLVGSAGGGDQQVQRQRQRNPRRRDPGLRPRADRRRSLDPRQGHRAKPDGRGPAVVPDLANAPPMGALKITVQQFYRPDGDSTQQRGVLADIELPSITTHLADVAESDLDYSLPFDHIAPAGFQRFGRRESGPLRPAPPPLGSGGCRTPRSFRR